MTTAGTSAGSGGPTGTGVSISDGLVVWKYVTAEALGDQKVGFSQATAVGPDAGNTWGTASNLIMLPGNKSKHVSLHEFDFGNLARDCTPATANCYNHFLYGITRYPITAGIAISTPEGTPAVGVPSAWAPSTAYAISGNTGAPVVSNGGNYYVLVKNGTSAGSGGPSGSGDNIADGTAAWARYNAVFTSGITGGEYHVGLAFQQGNSIQNATINDGTHSQVSYDIDPLGAHSIAAVRDRSTSNVSFQAAGTNSYAGFHDASTSPFGILQEGTYSCAAYKHKSLLIGAWGGDTSFPAISFNNSLASGFLTGFFGKSGEDNLYGNVPPGKAYVFRVANDTALGIDAFRVSIPTFLSRPNYTPASSAAACTAGDEAADANYLYRCTASNTWKRAALSTW